MALAMSAGIGKRVSIQQSLLCMGLCRVIAGTCARGHRGVPAGPLPTRAQRVWQLGVEGGHIQPVLQEEEQAGREASVLL